MKNLKKDNKGFSLVELIVVVLIMAIIAVALAPQVFKWVDRSKVSADNNTVEAVRVAAETALTNSAAYKEISKATGSNSYWIKVNNTGITIKVAAGDLNTAIDVADASALDLSSIDGTNNPFAKSFCEYVGGIDSKEDIKLKQNGGEYFAVGVTKNSNVPKIVVKKFENGAAENSAGSGMWLSEVGIDQ